MRGVVIAVLLAPGVAAAQPAAKPKLDMASMTSEMAFDLRQRVFSDDPGLVEDGTRITVDKADPGSSWRAAGVMAGDVLVAVDGAPADSLAEVRWTFGRAQRNRVLYLDVVRKGKPLILRRVITGGVIESIDGGASSAKEAAIEGVVHALGSDTYEVDWAGVIALDPSIRDAGGKIGATRIKTGFKLSAVASWSLYAHLGLATGDTIATVNGVPIATPASLVDVFQGAYDGSTLTVEGTRAGKPFSVTWVSVSQPQTQQAQPPPPPP